MAETKRRLTERIVDPAYAAELAGKSIDDLRTMREECREGENEISFERRLTQARIDILTAELGRREGKAGDDLVSKLPQILAGDTSTVVAEDAPLPSRAPDFSVPRNADVPRRRVEEIVGEQTLSRLYELDSEDVRDIVRALGEHESKLSARRKRVHEVMDDIQAEIVRRYTAGEADPSAAIR
jgi:hypothetical protein